MLAGDGITAGIAVSEVEREWMPVHLLCDAHHFTFSFHLLVVMGVKTRSSCSAAHVVTPQGSISVSCVFQRSMTPHCCFLCYCFGDSY